MERAVILSDGHRLEVARALGPLPPPRVGAPAPPAETSAVFDLDAAMAAHIESALARTRGRIEGDHGAAVLLDINPHTLRARMRKLGIDWRRFRRRPASPALKA
jgi:DNA-binding NtrC family response regulator